MAKIKQESAFEFLMKEITPKSEEITIRDRKFTVVSEPIRADDVLIHTITAEEMAKEKLKANETDWKAKLITDEIRDGFNTAFKDYGINANDFKNYYEAMFSITKLQILSNILTVTSLYEDGKPVARTEAMIRALVTSLDQKTLNAIRTKITLLSKQGEELAEKN